MSAKFLCCVFYKGECSVYASGVIQSNPKFRFVDLFAGIGGFHHALSQLGGECVMACELDEACRKVYSSSFPDLNAEKFIENIRSLTRRDIENENSTRSVDEINQLVPDHDVLCGGFPCQPFSKSGGQLGIRDQTRGTLFFDILEILRAKSPAFVILENVRNIAGPRHTETWRTIIESLRELGYRVATEPVVLSPHLIPPELGGAPQVRDRVFILGEFVGKGQVRGLQSQPLLRRDQFSKWHTSSWSIRQILQPDELIENIQSYRVRPEERTWLDAWDAFVKLIPAETLPGFPIWVSAFRVKPNLSPDLPEWETDFLKKNSNFYCEHKDVIDAWLKQKWGSDGLTVHEFPASRQMFEWQARRHHPTRENRTIQDLVIQMRPSGIRVKPPTYLPALVAISQTSIIGPKILNFIDYRKLTPREAAVLQGMPPEIFSNAAMSDRAAYKQLGNAVNVGVVRLAAKTLFDSARPKSIEDNPEILGTLFAGIARES